jgi:hypothetical protein
MTLDEFWTELKICHEKDPFEMPEWCIRQRGSCDCPVVAVARKFETPVPNYRWRDAAALIGLSQADATKIVMIADGSTLYPEIKKRMLEVLGLTEGETR